MVGGPTLLLAQITDAHGELAAAGCWRTICSEVVPHSTTATVCGVAHRVTGH
eukprot:COSAG01_NODE_46761_length_397_cov_0.848993_2_plen_51_part_01